MRIVEQYIVKIDPSKNQIVVGSKADCSSTLLEARGVNYLVDELPSTLEAQVRYRTAPVAAKVLEYDEKNFKLEFQEPQFAVTPGQSVVLYSGTRLLGGGFIA
ncbi:MAG: aminomethyltransferase beta-barrel domain-containing protein, partial [Deinococcales bacterium]